MNCSFIGHKNYDFKRINKRTKWIYKKTNTWRLWYFFLWKQESVWQHPSFNCYWTEKKYTHIKRIAFTCKQETCILESEIKIWKQIYDKYTKKNNNLLGVEEEYEHKTSFTNSKASYIERNKTMINLSDIVIFYYDKNYLPPKRCGRHYDYQPQSRTSIAIKYSLQKKKRYVKLYKHPLIFNYSWQIIFLNIIIIYKESFKISRNNYNGKIISR